MKTEPLLPISDRTRLRELAKSIVDLVAKNDYTELIQTWTAHNRGEIIRPIVVVEEHTFADDLLNSLGQCSDPRARDIERVLLMKHWNLQCVKDDKIIEANFEINLDLTFELFGAPLVREHGNDDNGRQIGFRQHHTINELPRDLESLAPSRWMQDIEKTKSRRQFVDEQIGDLMPTHIRNESLRWCCPTGLIVGLMGMELMFVAWMEYPELMQQMFKRMTDDLLSFYAYQENEGLLQLNNGNHYAGAGSYGFSDELPASGFTGKARLCDLWFNINSQETVGVSPAMYHEMVFPHFQRLCQPFGLTYYGCCEPVHDIWATSVSKYAHLRKVSISPWCDENTMGDNLRGGKVIYSRKPSPNYIGVGSFDAKAFAEHIEKTMIAARGCPLEFIFRDIYSLNGDLDKVGQAVNIVRQLSK
ncbi:MAG: hypothetical protein WCI51_11620 [Lentisphaerota bacterium]